MVLVTGGTGFLGAHLLDQLVQAGEQVRCLYRTKPFKYVPQDIIKQIEWVQGDLLDTVSLDKAMQGVRQVYHCAGKVSFQPKDKEELKLVNVVGTANVVNCSLEHGIQKLIYVSSVAALGSAKDNEPVTEKCKWEVKKNNTVYGKSKHLAELEIWRGIAEGLPAIIVNPSTLIGPSLYWSEGSPSLFKNIAEGFAHYPIGLNGFADVRDTARLIRHLMRTNISEERFIINNENWTFKRLFLSIKDQFNLETKFIEINHFVSNILCQAAKVKALFTGTEPLITKEMAITSAEKVSYSNRKIAGLFPSFQWTSLEETIADTCHVFLEQKTTNAQED